MRQIRRVDNFITNRAAGSTLPQGLPDGVKPIDVAILIVMVVLDFGYSVGVCAHKSPMFPTTCQFKIDQRRFALVLSTVVQLMTSIYLFSAAFPTLRSIFQIRCNPMRALSCRPRPLWYNRLTCAMTIGDILTCERRLKRKIISLFGSDSLSPSLD